MTTARFLFVGESRSLTAQQKDWTWKDGHLAAKPLFEALRAMGVEPTEQDFVNLFDDPPISARARRAWKPTVSAQIVSALMLADTQRVIVALGARVSRELVARGIEHVALVHPAARGRIRKRARYIKHVAEQLTGWKAAA